MDHTSKPAPRSGIVHVHDPRVRWGVRAAQVVRIVAAAEWTGAPAIDVLAMFGAGVPQGGARRVVVVRAGERELALLATGSIDVIDVEAGDVLPLPAALATSAPQISAIVVRDASLSLLLEPSLLEPSAGFAEAPARGEELCPSRS